MTNEEFKKLNGKVDILEETVNAVKEQIVEFIEFGEEMRSNEK